MAEPTIMTATPAEGFRGSALWLPPDVHPEEDALASLVQSTVSESLLEDVVRVMEQMGRYHPEEPHWYLPFIGVDPARQGHGHGSALLRHALARCLAAHRSDATQGRGERQMEMMLRRSAWETSDGACT